MTECSIEIKKERQKDVPLNSTAFAKVTYVGRSSNRGGSFSVDILLLVLIRSKVTFS